MFLFVFRFLFIGADIARVIVRVIPNVIVLASAIGIVLAGWCAWS